MSKESTKTSVEKLEEYITQLGFEATKIEQTSNLGATGSKKVKKENLLYQLKFSISNASKKRKLKALGLDTENISEAIASHIAKTLVPDDSGFEQFPEVEYVPERNKNGTIIKLHIASKYIKDVVDTDKYFDTKTILETGNHNNLLNGGRIIITDRINDSSERKLTESMKKDISKALAVSMLLGDHDINPGNFVISNQTHRVSRIDFGHAFNDLISSSEIFGGGVTNSQNRILDFINRSSVSHIKPSKRENKLWRSFEGFFPSEHMSNSFKEVCEEFSEEKIQGAFSTAQEKFLQIYKESSSSHKTHLLKSLKQISTNLNVKNNITSEMSEEEVISRCFSNIKTFFTNGVKNMKSVQELMDLQISIDQLSKDKEVDKSKESELRMRYHLLVTSRPDLLQDGKVEWIRSNSSEKVKKMDFDQYLKYKRESYHGRDKTLQTQSLSSRLRQLLTNQKSQISHQQTRSHRDVPPLERQKGSSRLIR